MPADDAIHRCLGLIQMASRGYTIVSGQKEEGQELLAQEGSNFRFSEGQKRFEYFESRIILGLIPN